MPYIKKDIRPSLDSGKEPTNAGELNYVITQLLVKYQLHHPTCYQTYNDMVGVLESSKLELYRRLIADYEDSKIAANGDVYL